MVRSLCLLLDVLFMMYQSTDVALDPDVSPSTDVISDPDVSPYVAVDPDASDLPSSHTSQG